MTIGLPAAEPVLADQWHDCWDLNGCPKPRKKFKRKYRPQVKAFRQYADPHWDDEDDRERRPICVAGTVKIVSTEHTSKENAMEAARKMWAASVQWDYGSAYMALEQAEDVREHCGQSNAMDTFSTKLNEAVNSLAGKEGVNQRCIIVARPCRARLEKIEGYR